MMLLLVGLVALKAVGLGVVGYHLFKQGGLVDRAYRP